MNGRVQTDRGTTTLRLAIALLLAILLTLAVTGEMAVRADAHQITIQQFKVALPIPAVVQPTSVDQDGVPHYTITMTQFQQKMAANLPPTTMWGYNGYTPGPIIAAVTGQPIRVTWVNDLPAKHLLAIDYTIPGAGLDMPEVRTVVHVHGMHVAPEGDGLPEQWFTPGHSKTVTYPNAQRAANLIFHDHAMGITRLNVYAGLIGAYVIVDPAQDALGLPSGANDVPLVIQDKTFFREAGSPDLGKLSYPTSWVPEYFGDTMLVNGMAWPFQDVKAQLYRFRVYNGCNDRFLKMRFSNGMSFWQIGTDGGLLAHRVKISSLELGPGQRADLVVDFAGQEGKRLVLLNSAKTPYPDGDPVDAKTTGRIMQFRVGGKTTDTARVPYVLSTDVPSGKSLAQQAVQTRDITLGEVDDPTHVDPSGGFYPMPLLEGKTYEDAVTIKPKLGTTEVWRYVNLTGDTHPMHEHDVMNRIVDRIPFNADRYEADQRAGKLKPLPAYYTGRPVPPLANENGWKDTVTCPPGYVTEIALTFTDYLGTYVYHCHILSHEEHDMMRPFEVVP